VYRKTTNIIESLKKRLGKGERREEHYVPSKSPLFGSNSLDRMLEELVPQKKALSPEAQKCLSLERNKNIFKVTPTHLSLACMFDSIATNGSSALTDPAFPGSTQMPTTRNAATLPLPTKALSDSVAYDASPAKRSEKAETLPNCRKSMKKPPFHSSLSSPSGFGNRLVLKNKPTSYLWNDDTCVSSDTEFTKILDRVKSSEGFSFYDRVSDESDAEGPLLSPSFAQPFRPRAMAIRLKDSERPRSSSAPPSPEEDPSSPKSSGSETDR
jgi:hypothetical protein